MSVYLGSSEIHTGLSPQVQRLIPACDSRILREYLGRS